MITVVLFIIAVVTLIVGAILSKSKRWKNSANLYLIPFGITILGLVAVAIVNVFTGWLEPARWHDDAELRKWAIGKIVEVTRTPFTPTKITVEDLHGLDHISMVVAGDSKIPRGNTELYKGRLLISDKPGKDYQMVCMFGGDNGLVSGWTKYQTADLNNDGKKELLVSWKDKGMSSFEQFIATIGWDGSYRYLSTLPELPNVYTVPVTADPTVLETNIESVDIKKNVKHKNAVRSCAFYELRNIDTDPEPELLCANMIWDMSLEQHGSFLYPAESHYSPHRYVIRVLDMEEGKLGPDNSWNNGKPLYTDLLETLNFQFSDKLIKSNMSRP